VGGLEPATSPDLRVGFRLDQGLLPNTRFPSWTSVINPECLSSKASRPMRETRFERASLRVINPKAQPVELLARKWGRKELNLDLRLATALLQLSYDPVKFSTSSPLT
jgi:hypothetical protein